MFIKEGEGNYLEMVTTQREPFVIVRSGKKKSELTEETMALHEIIDITGWKAVGTKIAGSELKEISLMTQEEASGEAPPTLF